MKIGPLFKWYGSKWMSAKHYPAPLGDRICEPFAGGAGYSLNHCENFVTLWEDDPNLRELWQWLIGHARPQDVREIPCNLPIGTDIRQIGLSRGQELLLKHWQRTNNVGDCWTISPWGHLPGQWTENTRARVADEIGAIKHWTFAQPIELVDEVRMTYFIDPPYQFNYQYRSSLQKFDYAALESFVQTVHRSSLVICCEGRGKNGELPNYFPFQPSHRQVTSRRKQTQSHHSHELVYVQRPRG